MVAEDIAKLVIGTFNNRGKVLIFGCGGSAAESSHLAAEFIGIGLPAISLTDPSVITALANDYSFKEVFSRQINSLANTGDLVIAFSTSGKSSSVLNGIKEAKKLGLKVIDWPRNEGNNTGEIQEYQLKLIHSVFNKVRKYYGN